MTEGDPGTAEILETSPGRWLLSTRSASASILVLAETAYPGWRVEVDGQPAEILTAYTTLKAVCVPPGEHQVLFSYTPSIYMLGGIVTIMALLVLLAAVWRINLGAGSGERQPLA
jgi:uncharacterized membrane protein YfhO